MFGSFDLKIQGGSILGENLPFRLTLPIFTAEFASDLHINKLHFMYINIHNYQIRYQQHNNHHHLSTLKNAKKKKKKKKKGTKSDDFTKSLCHRLEEPSKSNVKNFISSRSFS